MRRSASVPVTCCCNLLSDLAGTARAFRHGDVFPQEETVRITPFPLGVRWSLGSLLVLLPFAVQAQARRDSDGVPPGHLPPAGLCRIWYDGRSPGQQPGATDCLTAERRVPRNARVVYGPRDRDDDRWRRDDDRWRRDRRDDRCYDRDRRTGRCLDDRYRRTGSDLCWDRNHDWRCDSRVDSRSGRVYDRDRNDRYERDRYGRDVRRTGDSSLEGWVGDIIRRLPGR
jgi:hypothetical protein